MKRKLTAIDRIKIFFIWLKESKVFSLIETCHCCKSAKIKRVSWYETKNTYEAKYECMNCHATADVTETWFLPQTIESTE